LPETGVSLVKSGVCTRLTIAFVSLVFSVGLAFFVGEMCLRSGYPETLTYLRLVPDGASNPKTRILVLGDSFFARLITRPSIHDRLVEKLRPHAVAVLNTAVPGYGPFAYLEKLIAHGRAFRPDIVLVSYYVGNDIADAGCIDDPRARIEGIVGSASAKRPRSFFVSFLRDQLAASRLKFWQQRQDFDWEGMAAAGIPREYLEKARRFEVNPYIVQLGMVRPQYFEEVLLMSSDCAKRAWENTEIILGEILAHALGALVVPVIFPHTLQVSRMHADLYQTWRIHVNQAMHETHTPQDLLINFFARQGVEGLDLLPAFRAASGPLFQQEDEHLNHLGNALAVSEIARFLDEKGLLDAAKRHEAAIDQQRISTPR
jgi:hypothetical protein